MVNKKIHSVVKKYKKIGKPSPNPKCEICGGRVIKDREWVCDNCGLVQGPILIDDTKNLPTHTESKSRKYNREVTWDRKIHKLLHDRAYMNAYMDHRREEKAIVYIEREVHTRLKKYCVENKIVMYSFISVAVEEELNLIEEQEKLKNGTH